MLALGTVQKQRGLTPAPRWGLLVPRGRAPLTDAVIAGVCVPVVTLLPQLQDSVPAGASVVSRVVPGVDRCQLAGETERSYQGWRARQPRTPGTVEPGGHRVVETGRFCSGARALRSAGRLGLGEPREPRLEPGPRAEAAGRGPGPRELSETG